MRPIILSSLCIVAFSLVFPTLRAAGQQESKPDKRPFSLAQQADTVSSNNWRNDPTAFVHLVMGDDLALHPSAAGTSSVPVPDAVRQQIIGARITWTAARRASPFASGPRTLLTTAIRQGSQITGVLLLMLRRIAGDTEVCEAPYQNTAIDAPVEISGKVASFMAGVRPDGYIVLEVEVIDVPGCQANAAPGGGATGGERAPDLSGTWTHQRSGGRTRGVVKGSLELSRTPDCDSAGFVCFSGTPQIQEDKKSPETKVKSPDKWVVGLKGNKVIVCLGDCRFFTCHGSLTDNDHIVAECGASALEMYIGKFKASRIKR